MAHVITAISLECGCGASALRECIYAGESDRAILAYTISAGNDGTLGDLMQIGKRIESLLISALELGKFR